VTWEKSPNHILSDNPSHPQLVCNVAHSHEVSRRVHFLSRFRSWQFLCDALSCCLLRPTDWRCPERSKRRPAFASASARSGRVRCTPPRENGPNLSGNRQRCIHGLPVYGKRLTNCLACHSLGLQLATSEQLEKQKSSWMRSTVSVNRTCAYFRIAGHPPQLGAKPTETSFGSSEMYNRCPTGGAHGDSSNVDRSD
jgi:hypothetical protein